MNWIEHGDASPILTLRFTFLTGSADDPEEQSGVAWLTAAMLAEAGTQHRAYAELLDAWFPLGSSLHWKVDREMSTFSVETHRETWELAYQLFRECLLEPGWRAEDFERVKQDAIHLLEVDLSQQNDEELGKEALQIVCFGRKHPYGHHAAGTLSHLRELTLEQVKHFYRTHYGAGRLVAAAGGFIPEGLADRVKQDFAHLNESRAHRRRDALIAEPSETTVTLIEKPARSIAISLGFPIEVTRGHEDFIPLMLATSCLGQHRMSSGRLFTSMRQLRGLNYGDYAYIEAFPGGMFTLEPPRNVARKHQIFELWIRPVERQQTLFALRLALHELEKWIRDGLSREEFERGRQFLSKYVQLLLQTRSAELGYAIDSAFYGTPDYASYIREGLATLSLDDVNSAVRRHLRWERLRIVMVGEQMQEMRERLLEGEPSPMTYNSAKPEDLLEEDKLVQHREIPLRPEAVKVVPVEKIFA